MDNENEQTTESGFGEANYDRSRGFHFFKLTKPASKESLTDNIFRFFPPYGKNVGERLHRAYTAQCYGFKGKGKGDKLVQRPVASVEERNFQRGGIITQECPRAQQVNAKKKELEAKVAKFNADGVSADVIKARTEDLRQWLYDNGIKRGYRYAVMNEKGEFGFLVLSGTTAKKLEALFKEYKEKKGRDLTSLKHGCFINIQRLGLGNDTQDTPTVHTIEESSGSLRLAVREITAEECKRFLKVMPSVNELDRKVTLDQMKRLVACGDGSPETIDEILGITGDADTAHDDVDHDGEIETPKTEAKAKTDENAASQLAEMAATLASLRAEMAAKEKQAAEKAPPASTVTPKITEVPPSTPVIDPSKMSPEAFLQQYGAKV